MRSQNLNLNKNLYFLKKNHKNFFKTHFQMKTAKVDIILKRITYAFLLKYQSSNTFRYILAKKH